MSGNTTVESTNQRVANVLWERVLATALTLCVFVVYVSRPLPESNEPHYLGKAKHFWNASWCPGDFFLNTADAHLVFNIVTGWPSRWLTMEQFAWCNRLLCWALLAFGWVRLHQASSAPLWLAPASAAFFVTFQDNFDMAGEWVIGGVEAKAYSFAIVFCAVADVLDDRWRRAIVLHGMATAMHVLVGGWSAVLAAGVWFIFSRRQTPLRSLLIPLVLGAFFALFGLVPAIGLSLGVNAETSRAAYQIYVVERLPHHLFPPGFKDGMVRRFLWPLGFWIVAAILAIVTAEKPDHRRLLRLHAFVAGAVLLAGFGFLLVAGLETGSPRQVSWLRYYWFRMSDVWVPIGGVLGMLAIIERRSQNRPTWTRICLLLFLTAGFLPLGKQWRFNRDENLPATALRRSIDPTENRKKWNDWLATCRWIDEHLPANANVVTLPDARAFSWYAQRAEVVNWKDIPQDAGSIVEWKRRIVDVHQGGNAKQGVTGFATRTPAELRELGLRYGAGFMIGDASPRLELPIEHANEHFVVYRLLE